MKKVLILGVNGFIGHHLSKRILETTDWHVYGMDMMTDRITDLIENPEYAARMHFFEGDITINKEWVEYHVKKCDVILPLVASSILGREKGRKGRAEVSVMWLISERGGSTASQPGIQCIGALYTAICIFHYRNYYLRKCRYY
jgi:hypothetical protein